MRVISAVLMSGLLTGTLAAQHSRQIQIGPAPSCPKCSISIRRIVTLTPPDSSAIGGRIVVSEDSRGNWYVSGGVLGPQALLRIFGPKGRYVGVLGREGRGPGEFGIARTPELIRGDTMFVYDFLLHRISVLTPSGKFVQAIPLTRPAQDIAIHPDGSVAALTAGKVGDGHGVLLNSFDRNGRLMHSRPVVKFVHGQCSDASVIAAAPAGGVWVAPRCEYRMELRDRAGKLVLQIARAADWFPAWWDSPSPFTAPPKPGINSISQDENGYLWVMIDVADAEWEKHWRNRDYSKDPVGETGQRTPRDANRNLLHDTIVEVFDLATGRLIVSQRFPQYFKGGFIRGQRVLHYEEDEQGSDRAHIYQLKLEGYTK
jgi:hypothetical protein